MTLKERIEQSKIYICILPPLGEKDPDWKDGGLEQLRYAMGSDTHIIVWRVPGRQDVPIPSALKEYSNHVVIDGNEYDVKQAVREYLELLPGTGVEVDHEAW